MSTADGLHTGNPEVGAAFGSHVIEKDSIADMTLTGHITLTDQYRRRLRIDAGGSARNVDLPAEATSNGLAFEIINTGGETLTVRNDAEETVVEIATTEKAEVVCDGASWYHTGIVTIALS